MKRFRSVIQGSAGCTTSKRHLLKYEQWKQLEALSKWQTLWTLVEAGVPFLAPTDPTSLLGHTRWAVDGVPALMPWPKYQSNSIALAQNWSSVFHIFSNNGLLDSRNLPREGWIGTPIVSATQLLLSVHHSCNGTIAVLLLLGFIF